MSAGQIGAGVFDHVHPSAPQCPALLRREDALIRIQGEFAPVGQIFQIVAGRTVDEQSTRRNREQMLIPLFKNGFFLAE